MQVGDKFGCLTIIESGHFIQKPKYKLEAFKCRCECGKESIKQTHYLKNYPCKYCCYQCPLRIKTFDGIVPEDKGHVKIGDVFNLLTVIAHPFFKRFKRSPTNSRYQHVQYALCQCVCGKIREFQCYRLTSNTVYSCGCVRDHHRAHPPAKNGMKSCSSCNINQSTNNFTVSNKGADGLHYECKKCTRNRVLKRIYGISNQDYDKMFLEQNGKCGVCDKTFEECEEKNFYFTIDHDHLSGKIRGLLCTKCNQAIGLFFDNPIFLQNAINYLNKDGNHIDALLAI